MISVEDSAVIDRPIADVWAFVVDPHNEPTWHTDILDIRPEADPSGQLPNRWHLGSRWLVTVQFMGRKQYVVEITGLEPNRRVEITTQTGSMRPIATYGFEPAGRGTRFTRHVDLPIHGAMRLLAPLVRRNAASGNATFVQNLKGHLET